MHIYLVIANIIFITGVIYGVYVGGWLMFIEPIIDFVHAFDAGNLTDKIIVSTILKCTFAGTVGTIIFYIGYLISMIILDFGEKV